MKHLIYYEQSLMSCHKRYNMKHVRYATQVSSFPHKHFDTNLWSTHQTQDTDAYTCVIFWENTNDRI